MTLRPVSERRPGETTAQWLERWAREEPAPDLKRKAETLAKHVPAGGGE